MAGAAAVLLGEGTGEVELDLGGEDVAMVRSISAKSPRTRSSSSVEPGREEEAVLARFLSSADCVCVAPNMAMASAACCAALGFGVAWPLADGVRWLLRFLLPLLLLLLLLRVSSSKASNMVSDTPGVVDVSNSIFINGVLGVPGDDGATDEEETVLSGRLPARRSARLASPSARRATRSVSVEVAAVLDALVPAAAEDDAAARSCATPSDVVRWRAICVVRRRSSKKYEGQRREKLRRENGCSVCDLCGKIIHFQPSSEPRQ